LVDTLTYLPPDSLQAQRVSAILKEFAAALVKYQSDSGLWHQVVDRADSYEETSATGAISYYLARAVRQGLLPEDPYRKFAVKAIQGVQRMRISAEGDVYGGCLGTPPLPSAEDYMNRETPLNDGHAVAAVLYGAAGILLLDGKGAIPGWKESNSR
jgi:rhamnogalacturonyl hydrolase YesR